MRKGFGVIAVLMLSAVLTSPVFAETAPKKASASASAEKMHQNGVKGTIVSIDAAKSSITIGHGKKKKTYVVPSLTGLKQGDFVKIVFKKGTTDTVESVKAVKE